MINSNLIFAIFIIVLGSSLQFGYHVGVINAPMKIIENFILNSSNEKFGTHLTVEGVETLSSIVVAAFSVGGLFGSMLTGLIANKFGRKFSMIITAIPTIIGVVFMAIALPSNWYPLLIMGRLIVGASCGIYSGLAPVYLSEIAPLKIKGAAGTINQLFVVTGILLSQILGLPFILGKIELLPYLLGFGLIPCVIHVALLIFCPESPRYLLLTKNDEEAARKALKFLRKSNNVDIEIEEIKRERENPRLSNKTLSLREIFSQRYLRLAIWIGIGMNMSHQLNGINAVLNYSQKIFINANLTPDVASYGTFGVGVTIVLITIVSVVLVERVGRKTLHLAGLSGMLIFSICLSLSLILNHLWSPLNYFAMVSVFLFVGSFGLGPGAIPLFIVAEMFTQESRDGAITVATFANWLCQIILGLGYPQLVTYLGNYNFLPFVATNIAFIVFTYLYLPETKGKTPEQLKSYFKRKVGGVDIEKAPLLNDISFGPIKVDD